MKKRIPISEANARDVSLDYLRVFIVLLVLLHHSVLAYAALWPAQARTFGTLPVPIVDSQRWAGFDILTTFNDTFFMALMFLLSGLFVWPSLDRKGGARFMRERILRLGVPFAIAAGLLMPLAYYPSYVAGGADPGFLAYVRECISLGFWPSGPAWFIWLLLVFDAAATAIYLLRRHWMADARVSSHFGVYSHPLAFVAMLLVVSTLVYVPMELIFDAERWVAFGPFSFQASRLLLYASYFAVGIKMGATGIEIGSIARNTELVRLWSLWLFAGLVVYTLRLAVITMLVVPVVGSHRPLPLALRLLSDFSFVFCCGVISFAFIVLFRRFVDGDKPIFDSLRANSYGMYLIHYPIVIWLQFVLLTVALDPMTKGTIVYVCALALSWGIVEMLRRVPAIARVL